MIIARKTILHLTWGLLICLLQVTATYAATQFYLLPEDIEREIDCDYLEIKNNQVICTETNLLITYDLTRITMIEVVHEGKLYHIQSFTQKAISRINNFNSEKLNSKKAVEQEERKQAKYPSWTPDFIQRLSLDSYSDLVQSLQNRYKHQFGNSIVTMILLGSGLVVFLLGSLWYLIAAFRISILWGLGCIFVPFVPIVFLFAHWRVAAKPFIVSILGLAFVFTATFLMPASGTVPDISGNQPMPLIENNAGDYKCNGKIYCSEMTSCEEAKFYLRNCSGTKIDGNNDGVPCERQWCGN